MAKIVEARRTTPPIAMPAMAPAARLGEEVDGRVDEVGKAVKTTGGCLEKLIVGVKTVVRGSGRFVDIFEFVDEVAVGDTLDVAVSKLLTELIQSPVSD